MLVLLLRDKLFWLAASLRPLYFEVHDATLQPFDMLLLAVAYRSESENDRETSRKHLTHGADVGVPLATDTGRLRVTFSAVVVPVEWTAATFDGLTGNRKVTKSRC